MKDLKKMISSGEQVIGGAIMYGAGKEDIEKLLEYYDYDFIQTYAAAQRYLRGDAATEESVVKDYKARKESHGTAKKQRVKTRVAKRRSSTPTRR